jgi:ABC-type Fe2+-enterobactin transport system substrate-binding protein
MDDDTIYLSSSEEEGMLHGPQALHVFAKQMASNLAALGQTIEKDKKLDNRGGHQKVNPRQVADTPGTKQQVNPAATFKPDHRIVYTGYNVTGSLQKVNKEPEASSSTEQQEKKATNK